MIHKYPLLYNLNIVYSAQYAQYPLIHRIPSRLRFSIPADATSVCSLILISFQNKISKSLKNVHVLSIPVSHVILASLWELHFAKSCWCFSPPFSLLALIGWKCWIIFLLQNLPKRKRDFGASENNNTPPQIMLPAPLFHILSIWLRQAKCNDHSMYIVL